MHPRLTLVAVLVLAAATVGLGCGRAALRADMAPMELAEAKPAAAPAPLVEDHFRRDGAGSISEEDLRKVLAAPTYLDEAARIGVVPVRTGYAPDRDVPLAGVPGVITEALADSGLFEVTTEVSTDWPADGGISGLRELAARYRAEYLLLYRHRFVDASHVNAWALMWTTFIGGFFVPQNSIEVAGIAEATLFDVRTGTLLFTVYERVRRVSDENIWQNDRKRAALKRRLLDEVAGRLAEKVVGKTRRLAAARPAAPSIETAGETAREAAREAARPTPVTGAETLASGGPLPQAIPDATRDVAVRRERGD